MHGPARHRHPPTRAGRPGPPADRPTGFERFEIQDVINPADALSRRVSSRSRRRLDPGRIMLLLSRLPKHFGRLVRLTIAARVFAVGCISLVLLAGVLLFVVKET